MTTTSQTYLLAVCLAILLASIGCNKSEDIPSDIDPEALFVHEIKPLLEAKCMACHGNDPRDIEGDLELGTLTSILKGGESGHPALVPGNPKESLLYKASTREDPDFAMPPKDNDSLTQQQIRSLYDWIALGAPWPDSARQQEILAKGDWDYGEGIRVETSKALSESWANRKYAEADLWAFQPLTQPDIPDLDWDNPIDAFIHQKLQQERIKPASRSDKRTLIRRATFDLTGLPPTPQEVADFLADDSENAWEKLIDRLLVSPQYGEQWGRHWLDVARYADSDGFSNDFARPHAWRYRDYVIRSFNEDKPYDEFVREQIAGDEIDLNDTENLVATGFLRMGPWEHTSMSVATETRQLFLDDVTNSVGETFMATPLRCARCHDHKFDPIPTRDYYRIQAVFATTQFADRSAAFHPEENRSYMEEEKKRIINWIQETEREQDSIQQKEEHAAQSWYKEKGKPYMAKRDRMKLPESQRPPRYYGLTFQDLGYRKLLSKRSQLLKREMTRFEPWAYSVYNGPTRVVRSERPMRVPDQMEGELQPTFILTGGSVHTPSDEVRPGIMSAIPALASTSADQPIQGLAKEIPAQQSQRRLAFAEWLTQPQHPLTARVMVNRIWQYHFGRGIAENTNNFGATGKRPTHPELLDWLSLYFVENGWSVKQLHKLIMLSETYQRASQHPQQDKIEQIDPDNTLLARFTPRRLEAEELRDAMLFTSGELNLEMGGIPARPEINLEVALQPRHTMGSIAPAYQPSKTPAARNRRSIYALRLRGLPDPMLEVFNQPGPDLSCERRTTSTVTPQVFTLLNGQNTHDRALAMAVRLIEETHILDEQLTLAYKLAFLRKPTSKELELAREYLDKMLRYHQENQPVKQVYPTEVRRKMFEEMTGEPFEYTERLDVYEDYVADVKPWEVAPQVRALGDFCLVLFNTHEFIYVY